MEPAMEPAPCPAPPAPRPKPIGSPDTERGPLANGVGVRARQRDVCVREGRIHIRPAMNGVSATENCRRYAFLGWLRGEMRLRNTQLATPRPGSGRVGGVFVSSGRSFGALRGFGSAGPYHATRAYLSFRSTKRNLTPTLSHGRYARPRLPSPRRRARGSKGSHPVEQLRGPAKAQASPAPPAAAPSALHALPRPAPPTIIS